MKANELQFEKEQFELAVKQSKSINGLCRCYNKPINGYYNKLFDKWIKRFGCDVSHFEKHITIKCQHCGNKFEIPRCQKSKRKFCSLKCANQKVRGCFLPKPEEELVGTLKYRRICFRHHKKECFRCKAKEPITVHHYNENHNDDRPENLVPMCANCHILLHTNGFDKTIQPEVDKYVDDFIRGKEEQQIRRTVTAETAGAAPVTPANLIPASYNG